MRGYLPDYELRTLPDIAQTLALLRDEPGVWRPFAGGTDLMVVFEAGRLAHKKYLNLWHLDELRGIEVSDNHVTLGALTTFSQVQASEVLRSEFPMLCLAASETGAVAIQNRGTLGGNIVNASPAADSPPALLVYEAELELTSATGARWVPYVGFHTGYKKTLLRPDELVTRIRLQRNTSGYQQFYRKVGTRNAQAISKVCFAGMISKNGETVTEVRIALGSVAPTVVRLPKTAAVLRGARIDESMITQAVATLSGEIAPIDDIRSDAGFRLKVAGNLLRQFLLIK